MAISLAKGSNISLAKEAPGMSTAVIGLGWGKKDATGLFGRSKKVSVDLDASCLLFDEQKKMVDQVWYSQLRSKDGAILHSGDDLTGGGSETAPNEEIVIHLDKIPSSVHTLMITVNSYSADSFDGIPNAFCVLKNQDNGKEVARYDLSVEGGGHTGLVIAKLYRHNGEWKFKALGEWGQGRTFEALMPVMQNYL